MYMCIYVNICMHICAHIRIGIYAHMYTFTCIFIYIHMDICESVNTAMYMKSSFPKGDKHHSNKKWACNANAKFDCYVLERSFWPTNKCVYIYSFIYTYLWRVIFLNMISEFGIVIATSIFRWAVNAFWKRALHIHIQAFRYIYIYTYVHTYQ